MYMLSRIVNLGVILLLVGTVTPAEGQSTATSDSLAVNDAIKDVYKTIRDLPSESVPYKTATNTLLTELERLSQLDGAVQNLETGNGIVDRQLYQEANEYRALAWLHGWATFSKVAYAAEMASIGDEGRAELLGLHGDRPASVFALLLRVYQQLKVASRNDEPLRTFLSDGTIFAYSLEYRQIL